MSENKQFFIRVDGERVPVTEEVYLAYYRSKRRERYFERDIKTESAVRDQDGNVVGYRPAKEDSLDRLMEAGEDYAEECESVEDAAIRTVMLGMLREAMTLLADDERTLIDTLFFSNGGEGMSEREYADLSGIPRKTISYRREQILKKLKKLIGN